jgi:outer membrane lipopolysaccharide assembly protein LptE/RlpB
LTAVVAATLAVAGCGYAVIQNRTLFGAHTIALVGFVEDEPIGIAGDLSTMLASRLAASGVTLSNDADHADAVLTGRILSAGTTTAPIRDPTLPITIYRVNLVVLATLSRGKTEVWRAQVAVSDDFLPSLVNTESAADVATEANLHEAVLRLLRNVAQNLTEQLRVVAAVTPEKRS